MTTAKRILIAANPKSGSSNRIRLVTELSQRLLNLGFASEVVTDLTEFADRAGQYWTDGSLHCVVAAGGDGTVCAVAERVPPAVPIAIFPLGTENLLSKHLRIVSNLEMAARNIVERQTHVIDAGLANGKLFLIMASAGFDAEVVQQVHSRRRGHISKWTYAIPILRTLLSYRFPTFTIHATVPRKQDTNQSNGRASGGADNEHIEQITYQARWLFVFNVARYASNLDFKSTAEPADGLLNICTLRRGGIIRGLWYLMQVKAASIHANPDFRMEKVSKITIQSDSPCSFQLDGDHGGELPLTIEVLPRRVNLIYPATRTESP